MWQDCTGYDYISDAYGSFDIFKNISAAAHFAAAHGKSRPQLLFQVTSSTPSSRYCTSNNNGCPYADMVQITPDRLWDERARWTHAHEYGHALHHKGLGGIQAYESDGGWTRTSYEHPTVAHVEGFAAFLAEVFTNDVLGWGDPFAMTLRSYWPVHPTDAQYDGNGSPSQAAALMWDLADSGSDHPDDTTVAGIGYVMDLVHRCEVYTFGWHHMKTPEHFVYCAEGIVDDAIKSHPFYFRSRSIYVANVRRNYLMAPQEPTSQSAVRNLWLAALYNH